MSSTQEENNSDSNRSSNSTMNGSNSTSTTSSASATTSSPPPPVASPKGKTCGGSGSSGSSLEISQDPWSLFTPTNSTEVDEIQKKIEEKLIKQFNKQQINPSKKFNLVDVAPFLSDGIEVLVEDEFTKCFTSKRIKAWNWNVYLYPAWLLGLFIRFCILFPLRLTCLLIGASVFATAFFITSTFIKNEKSKKHYQRKCLRFLCIVFILSWSGVIKYHGVRPLRKKNQIMVANHTTVMDVVVLQNQFNYASVGQKHKGLLGFIQDYLLNCIGCLWFERADSKDRLMVAQKISQHIGNESNDPLLIFPEGVCVNNQYCVMFKKGAFELPNVIIYPIAIKYKHMFNLMTSWALVCDVWYLEPQTLREGETPTQFANRVKAMIAKKAGIINVPWDGYLKYFQPSSRFAEHKQKIFASRFKSKFSENEGDQDISEETNDSNSTLKQRKPTKQQ
eukprot:gene1242-1566_t